MRLRPFFSDDFDYDPEGVAKHLKHVGLEESLDHLAGDFQRLKEFEAAPIEGALRQRAERDGLKAALFIHSLRILVLGMQVSPGIFEVLELLGRDRVLDRMKRISRFLS